MADPAWWYNLWRPRFCIGCDRPLWRWERRWHYWRRHRLTAADRAALEDVVAAAVRRQRGR